MPAVYLIDPGKKSPLAPSAMLRRSLRRVDNLQLSDREQVSIGQSSNRSIGAYAPWLQFDCAGSIIALLMLFWMNLAAAAAAVRITKLAAIFFLLVLTFMSFNDYLARRMDLAPYTPPAAVPAAL